MELKKDLIKRLEKAYEAFYSAFRWHAMGFMSAEGLRMCQKRFYELEDHWSFLQNIAGA